MQLTNIYQRTNLSILVFLLWLSSGCTSAQTVKNMPKPAPIESAAPAQISAAGHAQLPIIISKSAGETTQSVATSLALYLKQITGGEFKVKVGDGNSGLAVGVPTDFPQLSFNNAFDPKDPTQREDYLLRSHEKGVYLIGSTELGVNHAVWDFLYRLGYRQFFPGKNWEIVPHEPNLRVSLDVKEHPDYYGRSIWYGFSSWDDNLAAYNKWIVRNRVTSGIHLSTGHSYLKIIADNRAVFDAHPEYLGHIDGKPTTKLNIANPELRQLVVAYALKYFQDNPTADCVSVEPSDGSDWGNSPEEKQLGSISDRVVLLANEVADAVRQRYPDKYVGIYAYNMHSPPPTIRVHPGVVVNVATSFIQGGLTPDQLIEGWHRQGAEMLGIREYYSVHQWDKDMPGQPPASNLAYLRKSIPHFNQMGARFLTAESSDNWGPSGLGYYLASRLLWDTKQADHLDELIADFLSKSFGPAQGPMSEFYKLLEGKNTGADTKWVYENFVPTSELIGRMYRLLDRARRLTNDPKIIARLNDLALYTHYLELYQTFATTTDSAHQPERQAAFEAMLRYEYQIHNTYMVHSKPPFMTSLTKRDKTISLPENAKAEVPEPQNPWKTTHTFSQAEIDEFIRQGIANHPVANSNSAAKQAAP